MFWGSAGWILDGGSLRDSRLIQARTERISPIHRELTKPILNHINVS